MLYVRVRLLVTENTWGELVTLILLQWQQQPEYKSSYDCSSLVFYYLNWENCENEQYLTCVKHLKTSVVCDTIPQIMGCLGEMGGLISF